MAAKKTTSVAGGVADAIFPGLSDVAGVLASAWAAMTDVTLWRSLGWIMLGGLFIYLGIGYALKDPLLKIGGAVAKAAV